MRVIHKDLKHGRIKLAVETLDDLWHLQHLVEPGDIAMASTWRRERETGDKLRPERLEKRRVTLSIRVESVEFHKHANRLRLLGTIIEGPDMGKHHSFSLEPGSALAITKEWKPDHLQRIRDAVRASRRPRVLLVALDDSSAELALVRQYGLDELGAISRPRAGKLYAVEREADEKKFFHRLAEAMKDVIAREGVRAAIVAGPGFTKDAFTAFLREKFQELALTVRRDDVSSGGRAGLYEMVRRGLVERVSQEDRVSREISLVEQLMTEIAKEGLATYGKAEAERAASVGAIEKLLVADELLRANRVDVEELLEETRKTRGEVVVISTEHDGGKQLLALGGIAALLRFKI
ncbi:MAG: mRNA surveillance protein pelota [Candidatus Hodarchaeaceae archaeon]|nr:mRNA surveillance protein pelota [Candidatus Hodarchaeaceae archaeon]